MLIRLNVFVLIVAFFALVFIVLNYRINQLNSRNYELISAAINKTNKQLVFYNRIPKTGSTTLTNAIAYDLSKINGFHSIHLNLTKNWFIMNLVDQGVFIQNVTTWTNVLPAFYHGHFAFIDFKKFGYPNPIYINLIREPFERFLSYYYFLRYGDNYRIGLKRYKAGNNKTFDDCFFQNDKECDPKQLWVQIPYFCGTANYCLDVGNPRALETAKWNLANNYLLVGLTERLEDTIKLLQHLLPSFFKENRSHLRYTNKKIAPSKKTIQKIKTNLIYLMERDFYNFAVFEFESTFKRCFNIFNQSLLNNHFKYEKIRPSL